MINQNTFAFLEGLQENNNKEWFDQHRPDYEHARNNFLDLLEQSISGIASFDPKISEANLDSKKCIMRINRDIRFSKDKTPYKTNFFGMMSKGGKKSPYAAYYVHLAPGNTFIGGGVYMPPNSILKLIRQEIDYNLEEWEEITQNEQFLKHFPEGIKASGELKRPPKGYESDNPALKWLRYKGFYTQSFFADEQCRQADFPAEIIHQWKTLLPLISFINRSMDEII